MAFQISCSISGWFVYCLLNYQMLLLCPIVGFVCSTGRRRCSVKKVVLKNFSKFTGKHLHQSLFFNKVAGLALGLKETLAQVFSCVYCEILRIPFWRTSANDGFCTVFFTISNKLILRAFFLSSMADTRYSVIQISSLV